MRSKRTHAIESKEHSSGESQQNGSNDAQRKVVDVEHFHQFLSNRYSSMSIELLNSVITEAQKHYEFLGRRYKRKQNFYTMIYIFGSRKGDLTVGDIVDYFGITREEFWDSLRALKKVGYERSPDIDLLLARISRQCDISNPTLLKSALDTFRHAKIESVLGAICYMIYGCDTWDLLGISKPGVKYQVQNLTSSTLSGI